MADRLEQRGHQVELANAVEPSPAADPRDFDAIIIAASIHAGRYQSAIFHSVKEHLAAIEARSNAFCPSRLPLRAMTKMMSRDSRRCVADFAHETGWAPQCIHHVAGAFRYTSYDFLKRWSMKYIAYRERAPMGTSRDYELTDWDDLTAFVDTFVRNPSKARD